MANAGGAVPGQVLPPSLFAKPPVVLQTKTPNYSSPPITASNASVQATIAAGVNPSVAQTLYIMGATDSQLAQVASGELDPVTLFAQLGGTAPPPGQSVAQSQYYPQSAIPQSTLIDQASSTVVDAGTAITGAIDSVTSAITATDPWLGIPIWVWLAGGGLALFLLVRK